MADVDKDGWALKPPVIDTANRRITVPPGAIDGSNFGDLGNIVREYAMYRRLVSVLMTGHGCNLDEVCNPCWDEALLMTLEAEGWTIVREATSPPAGVGS